jgi:hypothetical protein
VEEVEVTVVAQARAARQPQVVVVVIREPVVPVLQAFIAQVVVVDSILRAEMTPTIPQMVLVVQDSSKVVQEELVLQDTRQVVSAAALQQTMLVHVTRKPDRVVVIAGAVHIIV